VPLIKSWSLNWPWSTKILGQFVTRMCKFISQSDVKHIMTSQIKTISILKASTDFITNIPAHPIGLAEILVMMSVQICRYSTYIQLYFLVIATCYLLDCFNIYKLKLVDFVGWYILYICTSIITWWHIKLLYFLLFICVLYILYDRITYVYFVNFLILIVNCCVALWHLTLVCR